MKYSSPYVPPHYYPWPRHVPMPLGHYCYFARGLEVHSYPKCSLWHRTVFRLPERLAWILCNTFNRS